MPCRIFGTGQPKLLRRQRSHVRIVPGAPFRRVCAAALKRPMLSEGARTRRQVERGHAPPDSVKRRSDGAAAVRGRHPDNCRPRRRLFGLVMPPQRNRAGAHLSRKPVCLFAGHGRPEQEVLSPAMPGGSAHASPAGAMDHWGLRCRTVRSSEGRCGQFGFRSTEAVNQLLRPRNGRSARSASARS